MFEMTGPSMKYVKFLIENYNIVESYIKKTLKEKKNIISYLESKKYKVIDSNCNWIHFNDKNENKKIQDIFKENNILIRFSDIPHSNFKNWCRLTIQPKLLKTKLFKLL